jgi:hypothetical protein
MNIKIYIILLIIILLLVFFLYNILFSTSYCKNDNDNKDFIDISVKRTGFLKPKSKKCFLLG